MEIVGHNWRKDEGEDISNADELAMLSAKLAEAEVSPRASNSPPKRGNGILERVLGKSAGSENDDVQELTKEVAHLRNRVQILEKVDPVYIF